MKKSINSWAFPGGMELVVCMRLAKAAGFDGIELNVAEEGELTVETGELAVREIAKVAADLGLGISSLCTGLFWKYSLTSNDSLVRNKGKDFVKRMLGQAVLLGADTILVVPGLVDEEVAYDVAYQRAREGILELKGEAEAAGVNIGVENVWNKMLLSPLEFGRFVDEIGSEYVGAYFDVGNVLVFGYPEQWIRILGKRIKKVHIKDFQANIGNITGFTYLLQGDVNWSEVVKALAEIGYDDYLVAELPPYKRWPEQAIYDISRHMDRILGRG